LLCFGGKFGSKEFVVFFVLKQGGIRKSGWGSDNVYGFWFRVGGFVVKEYREQGQQ
jgi:hypothetical protein